MNAEELASRLASWLREKVTEAGCKGVVVGMSGGLDSSVVAVLCQRAFPQATLGVLMPCHSRPEDAEHAQLVTSRFSIPTRTVVLDNVYDTLLRALPDEGVDPEANRLAQANLRPRLRMLTLYFLANRRKYLVVGSSNRSELAVGYFTKHGDSGVDILPLGDLVKREVRELALFLGIPRPIIDKPPSAGLWPGQTDEDELGLTYEALDSYLTGGTVSDDLKRKIESRIRASRHKYQLPPIAETKD
jgi:NAD+ synthase